MHDMFWTKNPALRNIDSEKMQAILELMNETRGKPLNSAMPALMKATKNLKSNNKSFTNEETALIMELLSENLSPQEKAKLENLKQLIETFKTNR